MQNTLKHTPQTEEAKAARQRYLCPSCGKHTVLWLLPTTEIKDLPIKCKRCGKENVVNIAPNTTPAIIEATPSLGTEVTEK